MDTSRPTLSRAVRAAGDALVVRGRARSTRYAARRALRGSMASLPLFRIDRSGRPHQLAALDLVHPDGTAVEFKDDFGWPLDDEMASGWFDGLPYPMQDMRLQGFLGRHFTKHHAALLQVAEDPTSRSDDDVLHVLSILGQDVPGDLLVGERACRLWRGHVQETAGRGSTGIPDPHLVGEYPRLAARAVERGMAGSSAGSDYPKFTALRQRADGTQQHVLVEFSGSDDSPGTRRWADLLVCEHLAGRALHESAGIACANSSVLCTRLFGQLIGNSDMHDGNLSFVPLPAPGEPGFALAPIYDMRPMRYAPERGVELPSGSYVPRLPLPAEASAWNTAATAALAFWSLAANDPRIGDGSRRTCSDNEALLATSAPALSPRAPTAAARPGTRA